MALHSALTGTNLHVSHYWDFATLSARNSEVVASADIGKICRVQADNSFWIAISAGSGAGSWLQLTLVQPAIADFTNATHTHASTAQGGTVDLSAPPAIGGTTPAAGAFTLLSLASGTDAGAVVARIGGSATEGLEVRVFEETVDAAVGAAVDLNIDFTGVILSVQANLEEAITAVTAVKVGVGIAADPDKYGLSADLLKNTKIDTIPDWAVVSSEDIQVYACDTGGSAAGTISGDVRVRIVYLALNSLDDAV